MNTIVAETTPNGEVAVDVYQKLSDDRILFISDFIDDKVASEIIATLLLKDSENSKEKITLFLNSDGGDIRSVFAIYDMMNIVQSPIETVCIGAAMHESALLLSAGTKGCRFATKNAVIAISQLIHEYTNIVDLTDAKTALDQAVYDNKKMMEALGKCTGKTTKEVATDFDRRVFFTANQAQKYGLIDKVITGSK